LTQVALSPSGDPCHKGASDRVKSAAAKTLLQSINGTLGERSFLLKAKRLVDLAKALRDSGTPSAVADFINAEIAVPYLSTGQFAIVDEDDSGQHGTEVCCPACHSRFIISRYSTRIREGIDFNTDKASTSEFDPWEPKGTSRFAFHVTCPYCGTGAPQFADDDATPFDLDIESARTQFGVNYANIVIATPECVNPQTPFPHLNDLKLKLIAMALASGCQETALRGIAAYLVVLHQAGKVTEFEFCDKAQKVLLLAEATIGADASSTKKFVDSNSYIDLFRTLPNEVNSDAERRRQNGKVGARCLSCGADVEGASSQVEHANVFTGALDIASGLSLLHDCWRMTSYLTTPCPKCGVQAAQ
jgi:hypothetical protein